MYNFSEVDTAYLSNRYCFLMTLIEALEKSFASETDSFKARNLNNSLTASRQELDAVNEALVNRSKAE